MKSYLVQLEIAGDTAMWTRPDTGDCPVSYPAPTYSAVQGIFKSICWGPAIQIIPWKVEICKPLNFHSYAVNYGGPLRKSASINDGNSLQVFATVLIDVCYRLYAYVQGEHKDKDKLPEKAQQWDKKTTSPGHAYKSIFERRLKRGTWFAMPCLGWKEFVPSYVGPFREGTMVQADISTVLPSMLHEVFPDGYASKRRFVYNQNVKIINGVLEYPNVIKEIAND